MSRQIRIARYILPACLIVCGVVASTFIFQLGSHPSGFNEERLWAEILYSGVFDEEERKSLAVVDWEVGKWQGDIPGAHTVTVRSHKRRVRFEGSVTARQGGSHDVYLKLIDEKTLP